VKPPLFFEDIKRMRIANNWTTLNRRIQLEGFPQGRMIGRRRAWSASTVDAWLSLPMKGFRQPLRGWARRVAGTRSRGGAYAGAPPPGNEKPAAGSLPGDAGNGREPKSPLFTSGNSESKDSAQCLLSTGEGADAES
jgi:hypothetical protein